MKKSKEIDENFLKWLRQSGADNYVRALFVQKVLKEISSSNIILNLNLFDTHTNIGLIARELVFKYLEQKNFQLTIDSIKLESNLRRKHSDKWLKRNLDLNTRKDLLHIIVTDRKEMCITRNAKKGELSQKNSEQAQHSHRKIEAKTPPPSKVRRTNIKSRNEPSSVKQIKTSMQRRNINEESSEMITKPINITKKLITATLVDKTPERRAGSVKTIITHVTKTPPRNVEQTKKEAGSARRRSRSASKRKDSSSFMFTSSGELSTPKNQIRIAPRSMTDQKTLSPNTKGLHNLSPTIVIRTRNKKNNEINSSSPKTPLKHAQIQTTSSISTVSPKCSPIKIIRKRRKQKEIIEPVKINASDLESLGLILSEIDNQKNYTLNLKEGELTSSTIYFNEATSRSPPRSPKKTNIEPEINDDNTPDDSLLSHLETRPRENIYYEINVVIIEAANVPLTDLFGTSDPYCQIQLIDPSDDLQVHKSGKCLVHNKIYKTKVIEDTQTPVWNAQFKFISQMLDTEIKIQLFDSDPIGTDQELSFIFIPLDGIHYNFEQWLFMESSTSLKILPQIHVRITIEEKELNKDNEIHRERKRVRVKRRVEAPKIEFQQTQPNPPLDQTKQFIPYNDSSLSDQYKQEDTSSHKSDASYYSDSNDINLADDY